MFRSQMRIVLKKSIGDGMSDALPLELLSDEELVSAHLDGRHGAFQLLFDRYRDLSLIHI